MLRDNFHQYKTPKRYYKIAITEAELAIAYQHRLKTGEPINGFVRRLIRETENERATPTSVQ